MTDSLLFMSTKSTPLSNRSFLLKLDNLPLVSLCNREARDATLFHPSPATSLPERRPFDLAIANAPLFVATIALKKNQALHQPQLNRFHSFSKESFITIFWVRIKQFQLLSKREGKFHMVPL